MIKAENLSKTFTVHKKAPGLMGSIKSLVFRQKILREAVKGATFEVNEGEIVGLVGANGAGKTTLVKMLAGIIHPTSGNARVLGYCPWERDNRFRRQIALIMGQKAQLWWDLPAADCFLLLKEIYEIPERDYEDRLAHLSRVLAVSDLLNIQIRRLSLGERMKMELIAALLHAPRVVFLDEPTIGLDITAQRAIREFILDYQKQHRPAMILTSHYMDDIENLCDRIIIIRHGEFVYDGGLEEVVRRYAHHKIVAAHLQEGFDCGGVQADVAKFGEVLSCEKGELRLSVRREQVPRVVGQLVSTYPIVDISIEEAEIGTIIEGIMAGREGVET
ncbi:MAG: ATP-binding cassette domain-containing protein [bacterium]